MRNGALSIWVNGIKVGYWRRLASGEQELVYCEEWKNSLFRRPLSLSLPIPLDNRPIKGPSVVNFFENLLPENETLRNRLARHFNVPIDDTFELMGALGRDCVGAIQILKEDEHPGELGKIEGIKLNDHEIAQRLRNVASAGLTLGNFSDEDFRISLAGAQAKTAFLFLDGQWCVPRGVTPTTHIFKLPMGRIGPMQVDFSSSVDNEWLCLRLFNLLGVASAEAQILSFEDQRVLVVERFDRKRLLKDGSIIRLPQEDFCQALGLPNVLKYESDGGPGIHDIFKVLDNSVDSQKDKRMFLSALVLFWLLRAPDGHAKNFSISILPQGKYRLTKFYDILSTWPAVGPGPHQLKLQHLKFAMALDGKRRHWRMERIKMRHFVETAVHAGFQKEEAKSTIEELLNRLTPAIEKLSLELPAGFNQSVADKIFKGVLTSARELCSNIG